MKSFSPFKPTLEGTKLNKLTCLLFLWVRANAINIQRSFDPNTWKTGRPWVSYSDLMWAYKKFKKVSLGEIRLGGVRIQNKDIEKALRYEAAAVGICKYIEPSVIEDTLLTIYSIKPGHKPNRTTVLKDLNKELLKRGYPKVAPGNDAWLCIFKRLGKDLAKNPTTEDVKDVIHIFFKKAEQGVSEDVILHTIQREFNARGSVMNKTMTCFQEAVREVGPVQPIPLETNLDIVIKKYYEPSILTEDPERLKFVFETTMNACYPNHPIWNKTRHLQPKKDWTHNYEVCLDEKYAETPKCTPLQKPFMLYALRNWDMVRTKQQINIPGKRSRRPMTQTSINLINQHIKHNGGTPYHKNHPFFQCLKVQGWNY